MTEWPPGFKSKDGDVCTACGLPATHICGFAGTLMCGKPLCDDCTHTGGGFSDKDHGPIPKSADEHAREAYEAAIRDADNRPD